MERSDIDWSAATALKGAGRRAGSMERSDIDWSAATALKGAGRRAGSMERSDIDWSAATALKGAGRRAGSMERSDIDWSAATALKGAGRRAGSNRMRSMRLCLRCAKRSAVTCFLAPDSLPFHLCASAPLRENPPRWTRHGTSICPARSALLSPVSCLLTLCLFTSAPPRLCARTLRDGPGTGRASAWREALCCHLFPGS